MCNTCNIPSCTGCRNWNQPAWNPPYSQPSLTPYKVPFNRDCIPPVPPPYYGPCPTCKPCLQTGCLTKITTDCVFTVKPLSCLNLSVTNLTAVLDTIDTKLCTTTDTITIIEQNITTINETLVTIEADIDAGHFTPTLTNDTNITASSVASDALYSRVKNVVTIQYSVYVTPTASAQTKLVVTLPIALPANPSGSSAGQGAYFDNGAVTAAQIIFIDGTHVGIWFTPVTSGNPYLLNFSVMYRKS